MIRSIKRKELFKIKKIILKRLRKKMVWTSIISLLLLIFNQFNVWVHIGITEDKFKIMIDAVLGILIILGILNNPDEKDADN